jgi:hypothetical protein
MQPLYRGPKAIRDAIGYAKFYSRPPDADPGLGCAATRRNHQHAGVKSGSFYSSHRSSAKPGTGHYCWLPTRFILTGDIGEWLCTGSARVFGARDLLGLSRYVHLNPVRGVSLGRGTPSERRKRLRAFRWSSYRGYAGLSAPFPFVQETMVLDELRGPRRAERLRYRRFVEDGLLREVENPFEAVQWQAVLGDESFVQKLRDRVKGLHKQRREITSLRKAAASIDPDRILQRVAEKYKVDRERLVARGERGLHARM